MNNSLKIIVIVGILIIAFVAQDAQSQESTIILVGADATQDNSFEFGMNPSLLPRIIVDYATVLRDIKFDTSPPIIEVAARIFIEGATNNRNDLIQFPVGLIGDTVPPIISDLSADITEEGNVVIHWVTDEYADSTVRYGTESGNLSNAISNRSYSYNHEILLTGLIQDATYYYIVSSTDRSGNTATSDEWSFSNIAKRPWTIMYYQAADNILEAVALEEANRIKALSFLNANINVAVFRDTLGESAVYESYVDGVELEIQKEELNTGNPTTLSDFIIWAKNTYPAENYALVIFGHGHGLSGIATDETGIFEDTLTPWEFRNALLSSGPFEIIYMEACLVANLEHAYEARGQALYYVASEEMARANLQHTYLTYINDQTSAYDVAEAMARSYIVDVEEDSYSRTISIGNLSKIETVAENTNAFASAIRAHKFDLGNEIWEIIRGDTVQRFDENGGGIDETDQLADLYHFAQLVGALGEPELTSAANNLMMSIDDYIMYEDKTIADFWDHSNAHGLSIILTKNKACYYVSDWLSFAGNVSWFCNDEIQEVTQENGEWGQMLSDYILEFNPEAISVYDPPQPVPLDILPQEVAIAIQPDGRPSTVRCTNDKTTIEVAIITTDNFNALTVDHTTVTFEGAAEIHVDKKTHEPIRHEEDIDGDGDLDLLFHFRFGDTTLTCASTEGTLSGATFDGLPIEGTDNIRMTGG